MTTKLLAVIMLALLAGACESNLPETNPAPSPATSPAATQVPSPAAEAAATAPAALKAGDKVKVTVSGSAVEATVVSIDDKAGKATVKVQGETKERTVNLVEIIRQ